MINIANAIIKEIASYIVIGITSPVFDVGVATAPAYRLPGYMIPIILGRFNKR
jgi:hypothetical protein